MDSRFAKVLDLYSKGVKQVEIAEYLGHSQSLISKDLGRIKTGVKRRIAKMLEDKVWTYGRYLAGSEAARKKLWEIADDKTISSSRVMALELIMAYYYDRQGACAKALKVARAAKEKEDEIYGR